jgi:hypothetical protein
MFQVPETQIAPTFSGTLVAMASGIALGSVGALQTADWMTATISGSVGYLHALDSRPPLEFGGEATVGMTYTANLAANVFEGISGCYCTFEAKETRDYLVVLGVNWRWASANFAHQFLSISVNGSRTGTPTGGLLHPNRWRKSINVNPDTTEYELRTVMFVVRDLEPGTYTIQGLHSPWGSSEDRAIARASIVVL